MTKQQRTKMAEWLETRSAEYRAEANRLGQEAEKLEHAFYGKGDVQEIMALDEKARDLRWQSEECSTKARVLYAESRELMC